MKDLSFQILSKASNIVILEVFERTCEELIYKVAFSNSTSASHDDQLLAQVIE